MTASLRASALILVMATTVLGAACSSGSNDGRSTPPPAPEPPTVAPPPAPAAGTVSGALLIATTSQTDGDVNDPTASYRANDTRDTAQPLPVPVTLGGYVNQPLRGPSGRSFESGDRDDIYVADLEAGQVVELAVPSADASLPDAERNDADLALYDATGALVDESAGLGQLERLTVRVAGRYFVRVFIYSGATLYRLTVGQPASRPAPASDLRLSDDFIVGEAVVRLAADRHATTNATPSSAPTKLAPVPGALLETAAAELVTRHQLAHKAGAPGRELLLALPPSDERADQRKTVGASPQPGAARAAGLFVPPALQARLATLRAVKQLRSDPAVDTADVNRILRLAAEPSDPGFPLQRWHYEMIRLPAAWNVTRGRTDVTVAVVDTGVVQGHPDLQSKLVDGFDFIRDTGNQDGDGIDAEPDDPGCVLDGGSVFHGTHVAGTIGAATNNGAGVAGAGWDVRVMPLRALDGCAGRGSSYDIAQAIRYAAGLPNDSRRTPAQRADVINLSIGALAPCDATSRELFAEVAASGTIVVAAAGNENTSSESTPAACPGVLAVAATDSRRVRAAYSNFGPWVDLAAPGGDMRFDLDRNGHLDGIFSTHASGGGPGRKPTYRFLQGTSMAVPHVAGVIALMKSIDRTLTPARLESMLTQGLLTTAVDGADAPGLGAGLIDALAAVEAVTTPLAPLPATLAVVPSSLNFGDVASSMDVRVTNAGAGSLTLREVRTSAAWLSVRPVSVDAAGLGRYSITAQRAGLGPGSYQGEVEFVSSTGTQLVSVVMQVGATGAAPDAGKQYVLLLRHDSRDPVAEIGVRVVAQSTPYRLTSVPAGAYLVVAGTDMNNDGLICDDGEACGAYPVEPDPAVVTVGSNVVGNLDFTTAYRTNIDAGQTALTRPEPVAD
jgi:serine protease